MALAFDLSRSGGFTALRRQPLVLLALIVVVALAGGSARADSFGQIVVRVASVLAIGAWLLDPHGATPARALRAAFVFLGLSAAAIAIQLVPLPPALWSALPGRAVLLDSATIAGIAQPWRPIAMVPDRAYSALFSLLVPLATLVGVSRLSSARRAQLIPAAIVLVFASGFVGLAQLSGGADSVLRWYAFTNEGSATGFLANRNHQALLLAAGMPMLAAWATMPGLRTDQRRFRGWAALALGGFLILMLPTTGSRAGIALGVVGAAAALAIAMPALGERYRGARRRDRRRMLVIGVAAVVGLAAVLVLFGRNESFRRLSTLDATQDLRAQTLPTVVDMTRSVFPVGSGFGSFDTLYRRFEPFDMLSTQYFNQAHNDLLQLVLEGGVPAGLLLVAFVVWWGVASVRAWRAPLSAQALAARAGSVVVFMVLGASAVDYPARTPLILMLTTIAACWLLTPTSSEAPSGPRRDD